MRLFQSDLHIHTVLSPCGGLDMSPSKIVKQAVGIGLKIIAVTDHNSTLHAPLMRKLASEYGVMVLLGAEVTSKEEVHSLCLFNEEEQRVAFQKFINDSLPVIKNKPEIFGYQLIVNEREEILGEEENLLLSALSIGVSQLEEKVHALGGLFIPAHIDRPKYSLISQLGFVPKDLKYDALELSKNTSVEDFINSSSYLKDAQFIKSSDSHALPQIGTTNTFLRMKELSWIEFQLAIKGVEGRGIELK